RHVTMAPASGFGRRTYPPFQAVHRFFFIRLLRSGPAWFAETNFPGLTPWKHNVGAWSSTPQLAGFDSAHGSGAPLSFAQRKRNIVFPHSPIVLVPYGRSAICASSFHPQNALAWGIGRAPSIGGRHAPVHSLFLTKKTYRI